MPNSSEVHGAYVGAAIGDAMGGPIEQNHAARIKRLVGEVDGLMRYQEPHTLISLHPGYALQEDAGSVTDDSFIRGDFTRFYIETETPRTPEKLAEWMLENANFDMWWEPAIENMEKLVNGEGSADEIGREFEKDGINGWWTPIGVRNAGDPESAAEECKRLNTLWKAPVQQHLTAAVQAGLAEAFREDATYETVIEAMREPCGPLPRKLIDRAVTIAREAEDFDELVDEMYERALFPEFDSRKEPPQEVDAPLPPSHDPVPYTDERYAALYNHEQIPLAVAGFVFSEGHPEDSIRHTVMLGRDCDSTATSVGSWVGALHGESAFPEEWVETVCEVNKGDIDIRGLTNRFIEAEL